MNQVLIFGVGVIIGAGAVWYFLGGGGNRETLKEKQIKEKEVRKSKIMELIGTVQSGNARVSNDTVQKMLSISDASATRYLDELEKEGKVRQVGNDGRFVYYEK